MSAAGDLTRRLLLEAPIENADGAGGVTRAYQAVATLWAQVEPHGMRVNVVADSLGARLRYHITIRKRTDITTRHRFRDGARIYRILSIGLSADRRFLDIEAEEREDS